MSAENEIRNIKLFEEEIRNIKQMAFDAAHPVNETYTQYPQQDDPMTLYNKDGVQSTWQKVNYGGAFFRAEGGKANPYITKTDVLNIQGEGTKVNGLSVYGNEQTTTSGGSHNHNVSVTSSQTLWIVPAQWTPTTGSATGPGTLIFDVQAPTSTGSTTTTGEHTHTFTPSVGISSTDTETRPSNYTYIIWKRIS